MKTFIDTVTGEPWQFEDNVIVRGNQFFAPHAPHTPLNVPETLIPGELPAPPEPTMQECRDAKVEEINRDFSSAAAALTEGYPPEERLTWPIQQQEAFAWQADTTAPTPYLDGLAAGRGIEPEEMRAKTLEQTLLFMASSQYLVGKRQRLRDAVYAAGSTVDVMAISWHEPEVEPA